MSFTVAKRRAVMGGGLAAITGIGGKTGRAAGSGPIRIGVLNDQSGAYASLTGPGSVTAARMAIEDAGGSILGRPVELLVADHQNKADVGAMIAREWADQANVGLLIDIGHSAVALAVQDIVRDKNRIAIYTSVGTTRITEESCTSNGFSWCYDAYALANGLTAALSQRGLKTWFLAVTDYAFGRSLEEEMRAAVGRTGGSVVGAVRHPEHASDFSSYILQAIAAKPQILGLLNSGEDMVNSLKQALEFGFPGQIAAPLVFITDVHAVGLSSAQGLTFVTAFYWDRTDDTRRFGQRFFAVQNAMPSMAQAAVYSGVSHYLKSVAAAGTTVNNAVLAKMRALPVNDFYADNGWLRADGRLMHDLYLVQVKSPSASKRPWDYYDVLATVSAEQAFRKPSESRCPLLRT